MQKMYKEYAKDQEERDRLSLRETRCVYLLVYSNGKVYVGETLNLKARFRSHRAFAWARLANGKYQHRDAKYDAWRKHGRPAVFILETIPVDAPASENKLRENWYIELFRSLLSDGGGYNIKYSIIDTSGDHGGPCMYARDRAIAAGLCVRPGCKRKARPGDHLECRKHARESSELSSRWAKGKRDEQRAAGLCIYHGCQQPAAAGVSRCGEHQALYRDYTNAHRARKRRTA